MVCKICDLGIQPGHSLRCTWAHKKRESVQTWLMTKSLPLLFSLWSPGAPSLPSVMSGRDPRCKGLTCFSNTQTKEETLYHRWSDSVSWSRNNNNYAEQSAMSKPQRSQVKNYQKQSIIIITVLFLLLAHTSLKLRSVKGIGQNVNGLQLSGQKWTKYQILANAPGHLGFFEASSQNHIDGIPIDEICAPTHVCYL